MTRIFRILADTGSRSDIRQQVVADLVLKVAQQYQCAQVVSYGEKWVLRDLEDKVCYYLRLSVSAQTLVVKKS